MQSPPVSPSPGGPAIRSFTLQSMLDGLISDSIKARRSTIRQELLQGSGRWIRHIRISAPEDLDKPMIRSFVRTAAARAERPDSPIPQAANRSVVRAVYPKRRRPV